MKPPTARSATVSCALAFAGLVFSAAPALAAAPATGSTRVIVTSAAGSAAAAAAVTRSGGRVLDQLDLVGGVAADLPAGAVLGAGFRIAPDRALQLAGHLDVTVGTDSSAGADGSATAGADGQAGVDTTDGTDGTDPLHGRQPRRDGGAITVAVVDTGVADVTDLAGRLRHVSVVQDQPDGSMPDGYGHGTFVAGLIAGDGTSSHGRYVGVAPTARLLDVKVAAADGSTSLLAVLKGLQIAARDNVDVVNLSLSSGSQLPYQLDPLTVALEELWRRGTVVVVPAGNDGPGLGTVTSPGVDPTLLTVGSLDDHGSALRSEATVAPSSGQGPAPEGIAKPDLVAAGTHLVSLRDPGSVVDLANPGARVDQAYFRGSGTSFATAQTSGAAAVLLAARGTLTPDQVKAVLTGTTFHAPGLAVPTAAGSGGLDLVAATADVNSPTGLWSTITPTVDLGVAPAGDDKVWAALQRSLDSGDLAAAGRNWSALSLAGRNWSGRNWSALSPAGQALATAGWNHSWADAAGALPWAGRNWSASLWSGRNWSGRNWSGRNWSGRNWSEDSFSGRNWSAGNWTGRNWSGRNWSGRNWSGRNWSQECWTVAAWA